MDVVPTFVITNAWLLDLERASDTEQTDVELDDLEKIMLPGYNFILL